MDLKRLVLDQRENEKMSSPDIPPSRARRCKTRIRLVFSIQHSVDSWAHAIQGEILSG